MPSVEGYPQQPSWHAYTFQTIWLLSQTFQPICNTTEVNPPKFHLRAELCFISLVFVPHNFARSINRSRVDCVAFATLLNRRQYCRLEFAGWTLCVFPSLFPSFLPDEFSTVCIFDLGLMRSLLFYPVPKIDEAQRAQDGARWRWLEEIVVNDRSKLRAKKQIFTKENNNEAVGSMKYLSMEHVDCTITGMQGEIKETMNKNKVNALLNESCGNKGCKFVLHRLGWFDSYLRLFTFVLLSFYFLVPSFVYWCNKLQSNIVILFLPTQASFQRKLAIRSLGFLESNFANWQAYILNGKLKGSSCLASYRNK